MNSADGPPPAANLLRAFVRDENGTTQLLATLFAPHIGHPLQAEFRRRFAARLEEAGIDVPAEVGPERVETEYFDMDLVLRWGRWVILIENKIRSGSISRNQLRRYYAVARTGLRSGTFLDGPADSGRDLAVVYTPTGPE